MHRSVSIRRLLGRYFHIFGVKYHLNAFTQWSILVEFPGGPTSLYRLLSCLGRLFSLLSISALNADWLINLAITLCSDSLPLLKQFPSQHAN